MSQTLLMLKPAGMAYECEIENMLKRTCVRNGLAITACLEVRLAFEQALNFARGSQR